MKKQQLPGAIALVTAAIFGAALYDTAAIITRPLWPLFTWMLP